MKIKKSLFLLNNDLEKNISEITFSLNDELFNSFLNSITTKHQYLLNNEITNLTNNLSKLSELSELKYNDNIISLKVFNILINLYKKLFYFNKNINYKLSVNILNQMLNIIYMHNNNNYKNIDKNNTFSFNSIYFDYNTINFFDELLKKHYIYNDDYLNYSTLNETERYFFVNNIFLRYIKIRNVINENKTNVFLYELFLNSFKKFEFDNFENYNFSISKFNNKLIKKYNFPPLYRSKNFCGFIPITFNTSNNENKIQINNEKDEINISEYLSKNKNKSVKVISNNTIYSFNNEKNELLKNKILKYEEYLYTNLDLNFEKYNSNQCQLLKDIMVTYKNYDFNYELDFEFEYKNFEQYYNLSLYDIHVIYKLECELFLHYHKKIFPKHFLSHLPLSYNNIYIDYLINSKIKNTNIYIDLFKKTISYNSAKGLYDYEFFNKLLADYLFKIKFDSLTNQDEKNNIINQISKINKNEHFNYLDLYKPEFYHSKIHENELELDFIKEILKCSHYLKPHESKTNEHNIKILEKIYNFLKSEELFNPKFNISTMTLISAFNNITIINNHYPLYEQYLYLLKNSNDETINSILGSEKIIVENLKQKLPPHAKYYNFNQKIELNIFIMNYIKMYQSIEFNNYKILLKNAIKTIINEYKVDLKNVENYINNNYYFMKNNNNLNDSLKSLDEIKTCFNDIFD